MQEISNPHKSPANCSLFFLYRNRIKIFQVVLATAWMSISHVRYVSSLYHLNSCTSDWQQCPCICLSMTRGTEDKIRIQLHLQLFLEPKLSCRAEYLWKYLAKIKTNLQLYLHPLTYWLLQKLVKIIYLGITFMKKKKLFNCYTYNE